MTCGIKSARRKERDAKGAGRAYSSTRLVRLSPIHRVLKGAKGALPNMKGVWAGRAAAPVTHAICAAGEPSPLKSQCVVRTSVLGSWGNAMRDAVRNKEVYKGAVRLPKVLVLIVLFTPDIAVRAVPPRRAGAGRHATRRGAAAAVEARARGARVGGRRGRIRGFQNLGRGGAREVSTLEYPFVRGEGVVNGLSSTLMFGRLAMGFANVRASRYGIR